MKKIILAAPLFTKDDLADYSLWQLPFLTQFYRILGPPEF